MIPFIIAVLLAYVFHRMFTNRHYYRSWIREGSRSKIIGFWIGMWTVGWLVSVVMLSFALGVYGDLMGVGDSEWAISTGIRLSGQVPFFTALFSYSRTRNDRQKDRS